MIMVAGMLMVCLLPLAAYAQQQEWRSTSTMPGVGSSLAPQVTAVGAVSAADMGTSTTETYSPAKAPGGPRKAFDTGAETGQSTESPIGDAMWPLMLLACAYLSMRVFLKKKRAMKE